MPNFIYDIIPPEIKRKAEVATQEVSRWIKVLRIFLKTSKYGTVILILGIALFGALLVFAFTYEKTESVEIFPTQYSGDWQNGEKALNKDFGKKASLAEFSSENSANLFGKQAGEIEGEEIIIEEIEEEITSESEEQSEQTGETLGESDQEEGISTSSEKLEEVELPPSEENIEENLNGEEPEEETLPEEEIQSEEQQIEESNEQIPNEGQQEQLPEEKEAQEGESGVSLMEFWKQLGINIGGEEEVVSETENLEEMSEGIPEAPETELEMSEENINEEIATESGIKEDADKLLNLMEEAEESPSISEPVLVRHYIEFSGFKSEKIGEFYRAQLAFSWAAQRREINEILLVEYRVLEQEWKTLFLVQLNTEEHSNFSNNGYWQKEIPDILSWEDIENLEVRFTIQSIDAESEMSIYLDAVWLDVEYEGPKKLAEVEPLQTDDGEINFIYTDDNSDENLIIKTDKKTYIGLTRAEAYFSVTNIGDDLELVNLQVHFPESKGTVEKIEKWTKDVPYEVDVPDYGSINYFCEVPLDGEHLTRQEGWQEITDGELEEVFGQYQCQATQEIRNCDSLSEDGQNCYLNKVQTGSHKETRYKDKWEDLSLTTNPLPDDRNALKKILGKGPKKKQVPQEFQVKKSTPDGYLINPGETQYFKMEINFPINSSGEFYIEAIGDKKGYGLLDPWWDTDWLYKKPITVTYSGSALSDFQILVVTDTSSLIPAKMQSDCGDIRMIDFGEGVGDELDYWIESDTCNTASTRIWVEVASIPDGGKTIYMYYGKPDAPNASNGPNTFVYFNDFESAVGFDAGDLNPTRTTGSAKYDTYGIYGAGAGAYRQETRDGIDSGRDLIWETWIRGKSTSSNCSLSGIGIGHPGGGTDKNGYQAIIDERGLIGIRENFNSSGLVCSKAATVNWDTWYFMKFYWTSGDALGISVYLDPSSSPIGDCAGSDSSYTDGEYGAAAYKNADWDDYRVRKYAPTEPTTEVGSETESADVIVDSFGSQIATLGTPSTNQYIEGSFSIFENTDSRNITGITIAEHGTVDAQTNLANIKLYYDLDTSAPYDCAGESYEGGENQFGSATSFNGANGTASFTGSVGISTTQTMCVYVVLDVGSGAGNNETLEIKINNPSTDVTVNSGTVSPNSAIEISGTTTLLAPSDLQQIHYRWRNDDAGEAEAWWDNDWSYRKKITIFAGTGAGTDYQIKLMVGESSGSSGYNFHLEGNCQNDFDDIRFVDDNDTTQLDYWIEKTTGTTPSQTATVWVEVKDNLDSNVDIYVYYGHSTIGAGSSGISTFMFFDDFEDGNADGWTEHNGTWSVVDFDGSYRYYQSADTTDYLRTSNGESTWTDYVVDTKIRIASGGTTGGFAGVLTRFQDEDNHYATILDDRGDDLIWARCWLSGAYTGTSWTDINVDRDTWYDLEVKIFDSGAEKTLESTFNGYTHQYNFDNFASGKIALMMHGTQAYYDDIRVRKYASSEPAFFSVESEETPEASATWATDEDTELTDLAKGTIKRLRIEISNEGGQTASDVQYRLEVSEPNPSTCAAGSYERVSADADWEIADSSYITDGESAYNVSPGLTDENTTFVSGQLKDTGDQTSGITLTGTQFTEIEYSIQAIASATDGATYCFRLTDNGSDTDFTYFETNYGKVTLESINQAPTINEVSLNGKENINLLENSQIDIIASASVTDQNGCGDISGVKAIVYRYNDYTASCSNDPNNCYDEDQFNCVADGACLSNTQNYNCYASSSMQFFADPTDNGSSFSADEWVVTIIASDSYGADVSSNSYDDNDETDVEVNSLTAVEITAGDPIDYGTVIAGQNTGAINQTLTVKNTGNKGMDIMIYGTNLTGACGTIMADNQQYASTSFTYSDYGETLLVTPGERYYNGAVSWIKPTSSTPITNNIYWGINVPEGSAPGVCNGTNTFSATSEQ